MTGDILKQEVEQSRRCMVTTLKGMRYMTKNFVSTWKTLGILWQFIKCSPLHVHVHYGRNIGAGTSPRWLNCLQLDILQVATPQINDIWHTYTVKLTYKHDKDQPRDEHDVVLIQRWSRYAGSIAWKEYPWAPVNCGLCEQVVFIYFISLEQVWLYTVYVAFSNINIGFILHVRASGKLSFFFRWRGWLGCESNPGLFR